MWKAKLTEKSAGCDFDILDFDEDDFECIGWGWQGALTEKDAWTGKLTEKGV